MNNEIVVIGAGPGGTTSAIFLKQQLPHFRVLLFERERFPRHHIGESMLPASNPILARLGVVERIDAAGFQRKGGATFNWCRNQVPFTEQFTKKAGWTTDANGLRVPRHSWHVCRAKYDAILLERAREVGVEVHVPATVKKCTRGPQGFTVEVDAGGARTLYSPKYLIDASGMGRVLAHNFSIPREEGALGDLAFYTYFKDFQWNEAILGRRELSQVFLSMTRNGWAWFIPISEDIVSCGIVTQRALHDKITPRELYDQELSEAPYIAEMLAGAVECGESGAAEAAQLRTKRNWCARHQQTAGPGWFMVGDAACFVDPLLSSGTCVAHNTGLAAANAIITQERHPEIDPERVAAAYNEYVCDLFSGFQTMASWWYHKRNEHISKWFETASQLTAGVRAHAEEHDVANFITLISGYLADHRFANLGVGFGMEGMRQVFAAMDLPPHLQETFSKGTYDRDAPLLPAATITETRPYLATDPYSTRWWELPEMHYSASDGTPIVYRPPVPETWKPDAVAHLTTLRNAIWAAADGNAGIEDIVRSAKQSLDQDERTLHRISNMMVSDLIRLGALRVG